MSKGIFAFIKNFAESKGKIQIQRKDTKNREQVLSFDSGNTLQRLLKGVITYSPDPVSFYSGWMPEEVPIRQSN